MENYSEKLFSLQPALLDPPVTSLPLGEFVKMVSIKDPLVFEEALKRLAKALPFETHSWPAFGTYRDDDHMVELSEFKCNLLYCERGGTGLRAKCDNLIDLSYEILRVVAPALTQSAAELAAGLDRFADQRLMIWLRMSSEIYHMHQVNRSFGLRAATSNVTWMCQEWVRMGVFASEAAAFASDPHLLKGLTLSGMPNEAAALLLHALKYG